MGNELPILRDSDPAAICTDLEERSRDLFTGRFSLVFPLGRRHNTPRKL